MAIKITFSEEAEKLLEKMHATSKHKLNLVLHVKVVDKNCYQKIEPDVSFETDENYLEGIDKISNWKGIIDIYMDPAIKPIIKNRDEIKIVKGRAKKLKVDVPEFNVNLSCKV